METIDGEQVATNKTTGQKVVFRGGRWVPYTPKAASPPSGFQRYFANPATAGVSKVLQTEIPPAIMGPETAQSVAKSVVPQTPTQGAIDAAMLATIPFGGEGLLPALGRTAAVGAVGAGAEAAQGKDPVMGGISGVFQQGAGELLAPAVNVLGKYGKKALNRLDLARVGDFLGTVFPGNPIPENADDFDAEFRGGRALRRVGKKLGQFQDYISKKVGGAPIVPTSGPSASLSGRPAKMMTTFDDAVAQIRDLNDQGKYVGNDANLRLAAKQAREAAHQLTQSVASALDQHTPGLGQSFLAMRRQYGRAATISQMFSEPDLWRANGTLDWSKLVQMAQNRGTAGYRDDLVRHFGDQGSDVVLKKLNRNAPNTVRDIEGVGLPGAIANSVRMFLHPSGVPSLYAHVPFHSQVFGKQVGDVPRRFAKIPPAVPGMLLGQNISDIINPGDDNAP